VEVKEKYHIKISNMHTALENLMMVMVATEIHKLINSIWYKEELSQKWKVSIIAPIYKMEDKTDLVFIVGHSFYQLHSKSYPIYFS
jgi:hypothetical protein